MRHCLFLQILVHSHARYRERVSKLIIMLSGSKRLLLFIIISCYTTVHAGTKPVETGDLFSDNAGNKLLPPDLQLKADFIYDSLKLNQAGLERDIFYKGYKGYLYFLYEGQLSNVSVMTIADFSQSSKNKRLYVIDLAKMELVINTFVSHGKNSGGDMATSFSNIKDSYKSTLGFLITADTYNGSSGYSLRFNGGEPGINDRVRFRDIIVHGSRYVNAEKAEEDGKVGNSLGCPAVPLALSRKIIDCIKGGSLYFIYHPDEYYNASSAVLNATITSPSQLINTSLQQNNSNTVTANTMISGQTTGEQTQR